MIIIFTYRFLQTCFSVLFLGILIGSASAALSAVDLKEDIQKHNLAPYLKYIEKSPSELRITQLLDQEPQIEWQTHGKQNVFNRGLSHSDWWLKVDFINVEPREIKKFIEIENSDLDDVDVHFAINGQLVESFFFGDKYPFEQRFLEYRTYVFPISVPPDQLVSMYIRVNSSAVQVPLTLWEPEVFYSNETVRSIIDGVYFGALIALLFYNLVVFIFVRESSFLFYIGFDACAVIFCACIKGWAYQFLWPELNHWNDLAIIIASAGMIFFAAVFSRFFLNLDENYPLLNKAIKLVASTSVLIIVLGFIIEYKQILEITFYLMLLSCSLALVMGLYLWARGVYEARLYTISWLFLLLGGTAFALYKFGHVENQWVANYAMQLGSFLEVILLSIALANRINVERRKRSEAEYETFETQRRYTHRLERTVQERTEELNTERAKLVEANEQLEMLSTTDQLTGLKNRRYMDETLAQEYERCVRYQHSLSLLLLDIDFFKKINDNYGHSCGDRCLQKVGAILKQNIRAGADFAARYGGEEFCIVLPETDHQRALATADRIRREVEKVTVQEQDKVVTFTISIGLFTLLPGETDNIPTIIKKADAALYRAKETGRNRVVRVVNRNNNAA